MAVKNLEMSKLEVSIIKALKGTVSDEILKKTWVP